MSEWGKDINIKEVEIISKASPTSKGEYPKQMTKYERIKNMSIEEMANWLDYLFIKITGSGFSAYLHILKYLKSEADEDLSTDKVVSKELYEQVKWERDIALKQLDELGISLGQKIEREE